MSPEERGDEFPEFSFGLICPRLDTGEASNPEIPMDTDKRAPEKVCSLRPTDQERGNLAEEKTFRQEWLYFQPNATRNKKGCNATPTPSREDHGENLDFRPH